jgi:thiol-disulfide isomerase/thioredoxin
MMKKFLALTIVVLLSACGGSNDGLIKITGKIENAIPQGEVISERFEVGQVRPVETVYSDHNGNFELEVSVDGPGFYRLNIYNKQYETLILADKNLKVEASGEEGNDIEVTGSKDMENMAKLYEYMDAYQVKVQEFNQQYIQARNEGNTELVEELTTQGLAMEEGKIKFLKDMAMSLEGSLVSLLITDYIPNKADEYKFLDSLSVKLQKEIPNSSDVDYFVSNVGVFKPAVAMGDVAPNLELPNPEGEMMSLESLRGKYVLLDFWAGWCRPCRMENPNVVRMYNKYNDDGFEVFSVSLDRTRNQWVDAIEKDGLVWPYHVSDLKYFQSEAAVTYKINAIPFALLLDPEGRVIGKNLRGRALQAKLESIFGEGE